MHSASPRLQFVFDGWLTGCPKSRSNSWLECAKKVATGRTLAPRRTTVIGATSPFTMASAKVGFPHRIMLTYPGLSALPQSPGVLTV
jgi:hypothetical protein